MQGTKKPPTSEVVEASRSDWRSERNTSPPPRRDERADPDDDELVPAPRVDVVNVDGGSRDGTVGGTRDSAAAGVINLRRELAKLHQQAAAVEKSLDDQRRDRSEADNRVARATERALFLEGRLTAMEAEADAARDMRDESLAELQTVRAERDDLSRAVEAAKVATRELGDLKSELARLREEATHSARLREEATQAARSDGKELTRVQEELAHAAAEAKIARAETERAREAVKIAEQDAALVGDQASKIREEAARTRVEADTLRAGADKIRAEAAQVREELERSNAELAKSREELARAREDNTRDRATARDKIDLIERALDDARATSARTESELEAARSDEDRLARQLEAAVAAAANAESRAANAESRAVTAESHAAAAAAVHAALEDSVRRLHADIAGAFSRAGQAALPPPLPARARPRAPVLSLPPEMVKSEPPDSVANGAHPSEDSASEGSPGAPWSSSPASQSVAPPVTSSLAPPRGSISPTYASVPPQIHASHSSHPPAAPVEASVGKTSPPPPMYASVLPEARGSIPPPAASATRSSLPPANGWEDDPHPPATRRPGGSAMPPPPDSSDLMSKERLELLAKLVDPDEAEQAAVELAQRPEWLRSVPPLTLVAALSRIDYDSDSAMFVLARAWDREPLCHALITALRAEPEPRLREHLAWLLKHFAAPSSWKAIADLARSENEPNQLRRWLLEALDRLAAGRGIGWRELGDVVTTLARHPDAALRDGVVGILLSLDRSDDKRRLLLDILGADDDEVVLASAVNALASVLPMELDPGIMNRLLGHPSPRVQRSVRELIARARQTKG